MDARLVTECPACHGTVTHTETEDKLLELCLHCMRIAAVCEKPKPIVVDSEDEERFRMGQPGKDCPSCDD